MSIITGKLISEFNLNEETGDMYCTNKVETEFTSMKFEILQRSYISLGAYLHKVYQKGRYGIESEEDNLKLVEKMKAEFELSYLEEEAMKENERNNV